MDSQELQLLACPDDGGELSLAAGDLLACSSCSRRFPIESDIARLLPLDMAEALESKSSDSVIAAQATEARKRDEEASLYDEIHPDDEYRHELDRYVEMLALESTDVLLDIGVGTGRVLKEYAARCQRVAGADLSFGSLRHLASREDLGQEQLLLVEADATRLPFATAQFDRAAALSMMCFLPSEERRRSFVSELKRVLKPGGTLLVSTYHHAWVKRLWAALGRTEGALKEGWHSEGSIWYRNETEAEFVETLSAEFEVHEVLGVCHRVPLLSNLSVPISRGLDGLLNRLSLAKPLFATEIVATCTPRDA